jgi:hypothetical protein
MFFTNRGALRVGPNNWVGTTLKVMLLNSTTVPTRAINTVSEIAGTEISVANYVPGFAGAGRLTLAGKANVENDGSNRVESDANDFVWTNLGAGARIGVLALIEEITNDAGSNVIGFYDLNGDAIAASAATNAAAAVLTVTGHGLSTGDIVTITGAAGGTWTTLNTNRYAVTVIDANTFSIPVNSTGFGTYTASSAQVARPVITNGTTFTATVNALGLLNVSTV